jgi:hypothetical protein
MRRLLSIQRNEREATVKHHDEDEGKGAVEQDRRGQETNVSMAGELGGRDQDPLLKSANSDHPERGQNEEHTGEPHTRDELDRDTEVNPDCGAPPARK